MTGAGIEPYIHDIGFLAEMSCSTFGTGQTFWNQFYCVLGKPDIRTMLAEQLLNVGDGIIIDNRFITFCTVENRNRHAPCALSGNTPVAAICYHIINAVMSPGWEEFYFINLIQRILAEPVNGGKPLLCCAEQGGVFAAPAMRILVFDKFQF